MFAKKVETFDQIPSEIVLPIAQPEPGQSIADAIEAVRNSQLNDRVQQCKPIKRMAKQPHRPKQLYMRRFFCVCPRFRPQYVCRHSGGNVILDRDVLTTDEHICFLATPKRNHGAKRHRPWYYYQRVALPNCTQRIEQLAVPPKKVVKDNLKIFSHLLKRRHRNALAKYLAPKGSIQVTSLKTAMAYVIEERRLQKVAKNHNKRRCQRMRRCILRKQRNQIKKIVLVLFEELKDFLLNDQFIVDESSTLSPIILEQIQKFTDNVFHATTNLSEYQVILANNLTVWINKFVSNLNIHVPQRPEPKMDRPSSTYFLPIDDYISKSDENEEYGFEEENFSMMEEAIITEGELGETDGIELDSRTD